jgi:hypothetical protein
LTTYSIERETLDGRDIHVVMLSGEVNVPDVLVLIDQLNALAREQPSFELLVDESEAKASLIGPLDLRKLAQAWSESAASKRARIAIFAPTPVIYGLNRMVQSFGAGEGRLKVFKSRAAATAWLLDDA